MTSKKNLFKSASFIVVFVFVLALSYRYRFFTCASFMEHFVSYKIELPQDKIFNVKIEHDQLPQFIKHIINFAFPEYIITYDNSKPAHLIVRTGYRGNNDNLIDQITEKVPYLVFYPEKREVDKNRYRASGYPLHQFVTIKNFADDNMSYIPFVVYAKKHENYLSANKRNVPSITELSNRDDLVYVFRHCVNIRDDFFILLKNYLETSHSYGKCLNNTDKKAPGGYNDLKKLYSKYKFVIAMEHAKVPGYLTEKIINAFEAQSIPIYWGDDEIVNEIFNPDSYINLSKFKNFDEAAQYIGKLSNDYTKLQQILSAPVLNPKGEILISINKEELPPESKKILEEIAKKIRAEYLNRIHDKKLF